MEVGRDEGSDAPLQLPFNRHPYRHSCGTLPCCGLSSLLGHFFASHIFPSIHPLTWTPSSSTAPPETSPARRGARLCPPPTRSNALRTRSSSSLSWRSARGPRDLSVYLFSAEAVARLADAASAREPALHIRAIPNGVPRLAGVSQLPQLPLLLGEARVRSLHHVSAWASGSRH